jgi:hypothetical protein
MSTPSASQDKKYPMPSAVCLQRAASLAIEEDRPVMLDYWLDSLKEDQTAAVIGVTESKEKMLVKSEQEFTSPVAAIFRASPEEYIVKTENSLYIVSSKIKQRRIK